MGFDEPRSTGVFLDLDWLTLGALALGPVAFFAALGVIGVRRRRTRSEDESVTGRIALLLGCVAMCGAAVAFSFIALLATGVDSAFAFRSGWIYAPLLVALIFTAAALVATAARRPAVSTLLLSAAAVAFAVTWMVWGPLDDPSV